MICFQLYEQKPIETKGLQSQQKRLQEQSPPGLSNQNLYFPLHRFWEIRILNATPEDFSTVGYLELEVCCWPTPQGHDEKEALHLLPMISVNH